MSYPKPLSEKSLKRLYTQAGLSTEACDFLHSLFAACANLYGAIALRDVWSVYRELKSEAPRIRRQDLVAFSAIVRREVQPYRVYEIEELYIEEPHNDLDRHIVSKELIGTGYGKMFSFYALMEGLGDHPHCVPDNFLSYAAPSASAVEKSLADFIGNLESTAEECAPRQRKAYPNENRGKKLGTFSFLNLSERFDLEYYKKSLPHIPLCWKNTAVQKRKKSCVSIDGMKILAVCTQRKSFKTWKMNCMRSASA